MQRLDYIMKNQSSLSENNLYNKFCLEAATDDNVFNNFKQNQYYNEILEHVHPILGEQYYEITKNYYPKVLDKINEIKINDSFGNPQMFDYYFGRYSPTTLRYLKVAAELNHCFEDISSYSILEIGGGYGGQSIVSSILHGYKSWTIVDLPEVVELQRKYLNKFEYKNINAISFLEDYTNQKYDLIISNYAFTECNRMVEMEYINKVMSNNEKIYMTLNFIQTHDDNFKDMLSLDELKNILKIKIFKELPNTSPNNCIGLRNNIKDPYTT